MKLFIILVLLVLLGTPEVLSEGKNNTSLWRFFFPPKDLFDLVVNEGIDITTTGEVASVIFRLKYDGPYNAGIYLAKLPNNGLPSDGTHKYVFKLRVRIDVFQGDQLFFSDISTSEYSSFMGLRGNGLQLLRFNAPEDVPLKKELTCKVTVLVPDKALNKNFGPVSFYIQKASEK